MGQIKLSNNTKGISTIQIYLLFKPYKRPLFIHNEFLSNQKRKKEGEKFSHQQKLDWDKSRNGNGIFETIQNFQVSKSKNFATESLHKKIEIKLRSKSNWKSVKTRISNRLVFYCMRNSVRQPKWKSVKEWCLRCRLQLNRGWNWCNRMTFFLCWIISSSKSEFLKNKEYLCLSS